MSAMVIPTARVSGGRSGSAAERARELWFSDGSASRTSAVPTPRRGRTTGPTTQGARSPHAARAAAPGRPAQGAGRTAGATTRAGAPDARAAAARTVPVSRRSAAPGSVTRAGAAGQRRAAASAVSRGAAPAVGRAASRPAERPLHLTRRGRLVVLLLAALVLAGGIQGGQALADGPSRALEVTTYTVAPGETLWEIAAERAHPGEDVRDVVHELKTLNGLVSAGLAAGQELILPVQR